MVEEICLFPPRRILCGIPYRTPTCLALGHEPFPKPCSDPLRVRLCRQQEPKRSGRLQLLGLQWEVIDPKRKRH
jgi:hypothetical protein